MNAKNTAAVHQSLLPLALLSGGVTRSTRRGNRVRLYRSDSSLPVDLTAPIKALLEQGRVVRVYEGLRIYTPRIAEDGVLIWPMRWTVKERAKTVVEVEL